MYTNIFLTTLCSYLQLYAVLIYVQTGKTMLHMTENSLSVQMLLTAFANPNRKDVVCIIGFVLLRSAA